MGVAVLSTLGQTVDGDESKDEGSKPNNHRQERESLSRTPLAAGVGTAEGEASPVPCAATASVVEPAHKKSEYGSPASGEDEVRNIAGHRRCCGDSPDNSGEDGKRSPDDGVDQTSIRTNAILVVCMEEVCG